MNFVKSRNFPIVLVMSCMNSLGFIPFLPPSIASILLRNDTLSSVLPTFSCFLTGWISRQRHSGTGTTGLPNMWGKAGPVLSPSSTQNIFFLLSVYRTRNIFPTLIEMLLGLLRKRRVNSSPKHNLLLYKNQHQTPIGTSRPLSEVEI